MTSELALVLAAMPGLARALVQEHIQTLTGRCAVCVAGPQRGGVVHPCRTYVAANAALVEIAKRHAS